MTQSSTDPPIFYPPPPNPYANPYANPYGNPYANPYANQSRYGIAYPPGMNYEQMMAYRQEMLRQQNEYHDKMLKENFPVKYAVVHSAILILISGALIGMQIAQIVNQIGIYYVGSGIWVSGFLLFCAGLVLLLIKFRNRCLFLITILMHVFGFLVALGGSIGPNMVSLVLYGTSSYSSSSYSSYNSYYYYWATTTTTTTKSADLGTTIGLPVASLVLGIIAGITCCVFVVAINCLLNPGCNGGKRVGANYPNSAIQMTSYPTNTQQTNLNNKIY